MTESFIEISRLSYRQPETDRDLFTGFSLPLEAGKCHVFLGRSGCGKSTLLRLIAGLLQPDSGSIDVQPTTAGQNSHQQFLFQDYDCFPWLTVFENVRQGSGPLPHPSDEAVEAILAQVGLADKKHVYPKALSGGMRKRLGFARTLIRRPRLLLLDEPFASLDIALRSDMYDLLQTLIADHGTTVLLVSHDLHEALILGDVIHILGNNPAYVIDRIDNPFQHPRDENIVQSDFYSRSHKRIAALLKSAG